MQISRFGIRLESLREGQIEMVRQWRNAPEIRDFMEYREHITPQMQSRWFHQLKPLHDFYFVIFNKEQPVGLIHTSDIDWQKKTGHSGLFIWKKELLGSPVPVLASLSMVDFFFCFCNLQTLFAKVMQKNPVAVNYNKKLGFVAVESSPEKDFAEYFLSKENYFRCTKKLHAMAESVGEGEYEIILENEMLENLKKHNALNPAFSEKNLKVLQP